MHFIYDIRIYTANNTENTIEGIRQTDTGIAIKNKIHAAFENRRKNIRR